MAKALSPSTSTAPPRPGRRMLWMMGLSIVVSTLVIISAIQVNFNAQSSQNILNNSTQGGPTGLHQFLPLSIPWFSRPTHASPPSFPPPSPEFLASLPPRPVTSLDPTKKYLTFLPFEGITNQFFSFQNAASIAKRMNRTLILPPITSNRHDRLRTHQPWSHYIDLPYFGENAGVDVVEWTEVKKMDAQLRQIVSQGSRIQITPEWFALSEPLPVQVIRGHGADYFWTTVEGEDSIGADFAYQFMLQLQPIPVPGFSLQDGAPGVDLVDQIVDANAASEEKVVCLSYTFTAQFEVGSNRWDIGWEDVGKYIRFLPRFEAYVEDVIAYRLFRNSSDAANVAANNRHDDSNSTNNTVSKQVQDEIKEDNLLVASTPPHPPRDLGFSVLDKGTLAETFLARKPPIQDYIAIHLRRGDINVKCEQAVKAGNCIVPLSIYKYHVDAILSRIPTGNPVPKVVLVSDTEDESEKALIDSFGWYRLDHEADTLLKESTSVLGPFSPALIDSAVLVGRSAGWTLGSRRSTMSWLAAMRTKSWHNRKVRYPVIEDQEAMDEAAAKQKIQDKSKGKQTKVKTKADGQESPKIAMASGSSGKKNLNRYNALDNATPNRAKKQSQQQQQTQQNARRRLATGDDIVALDWAEQHYFNHL